MKKHYKTILTLIFLTMLVLFFRSCDDCHTYNCYDPTTTVDVNYKIKVDSAEFYLDTVNITDSLVIAFWGIIGNDSCYAFGYFQVGNYSHRTDLTLWSVHHETTAYGNNVPCGSETVLLNGITYKIYPLASGDFTVVIHQPDGSTLSKNAYVR